MSNPHLYQFKKSYTQGFVCYNQYYPTRDNHKITSASNSKVKSKTRDGKKNPDPMGTHLPDPNGDGLGRGLIRFGWVWNLKHEIVRVWVGLLESELQKYPYSF